jgi:predicted metal-binding membrane protein
VIAAAFAETGLAPALAAARARVGLVALLVGLAGLCWWSTVDRMRGMNGGPGANLGTLGWFVGVWVVMMAAMMFPSVFPTVALYARMTQRTSPARPLVFTSGYLLIWTAVGVFAFALARVADAVLGGQLVWDRGGRWAAGATLVLAAVYELTPLKDVCLGKCRSPLGFLLGSWRDGITGALRLGVSHGAWCVGCCWALMAALFALGIMSLTWMASIAAMVALEKLIPSQRVATLAVTAILLALAVLVLAAPEVVPGFTVPGHTPTAGMR